MANEATVEYKLETTKWYRWAKRPKMAATDDVQASMAYIIFLLQATLDKRCGHFDFLAKKSCRGSCVYSLLVLILLTFCVPLFLNRIY